MTTKSVKLGQNGNRTSSHGTEWRAPLSSVKCHRCLKFSHVAKFCRTHLPASANTGHDKQAKAQNKEAQAKSKSAVLANCVTTKSPKSISGPTFISAAHVVQSDSDSLLIVSASEAFLLQIDQNCAQTTDATEKFDLKSGGMLMSRIHLSILTVC